MNRVHSLLAALLPCVAALGLLVVAGCNTSSTPSGSSTKLAVDPDAPKSGVIKIFSSLPHTGSAKKQADDIANGIAMAFEEVDNKVGDFEIRYQRLDDASAAAGGKWDPTLEAANARKAANDPDVMIYLGPYTSGAAKVSTPILTEVGK